MIPAERIPWPGDHRVIGAILALVLLLAPTAGSTDAQGEPTAAGTYSTGDVLYPAPPVSNTPITETSPTPTVTGTEAPEPAPTDDDTGFWTTIALVVGGALALILGGLWLLYRNRTKH